MEKNGLSVERLRPVDYDIANGVWPDMTEHGWDKDVRPQISENQNSNLDVGVVPRGGSRPSPRSRAEYLHLVWTIVRSNLRTLGKLQSGIGLVPLPR